MRNKIVFSVMAIGAIILLAGCDKSENTGNATLQVMLTDAPGDFDEVLIDIRDVQIHTSTSDNEGGWQSLDVNEGVYNLLDFRNGMDTLLAAIELPAGSISQMRLVLGPENQIKVGDVYFDLETPSAQQSGLKFNINANLTAGLVYKLWIDFDAARSIVLKGNEGYSLKPVIRTFSEAVSGAIAGVVSPVESLPYVMAVSDGDTMGAFAGTDGLFLIKGVTAGTWSVILDPVDPFVSDTVNNVMVENGVVSVMDTVFFTQP
jgi:hypothetical protein